MFPAGAVPLDSLCIPANPLFSRLPLAHYSAGQPAFMDRHIKTSAALHPRTSARERGLFPQSSLPNCAAQTSNFQRRAAVLIASRTNPKLLANVAIGSPLRRKNHNFGDCYQMLASDPQSPRNQGTFPNRAVQKVQSSERFLAISSSTSRPIFCAVSATSVLSPIDNGPKIFNHLVI